FLYIDKIPKKPDKLFVFPIHQEIVDSLVGYLFQVFYIFLQPEVYKSVENYTIRIVKIIHQSLYYDISPPDLKKAVDKSLIFIPDNIKRPGQYFFFFDCIKVAEIAVDDPQ